MFRKRNVNKTVNKIYFFVSLNYREIVTVKTVELYKKLFFFFHWKSSRQVEEADTNLVLLCQSKNMVEQFNKPYLHIPIKIRRVANVGPEDHGPPTSSSEPKKGSTVSVSNIRNIALYGCSEIIRTRNFKIFTSYGTVFG